MIYNFNLGIGWASSGVEYAQAYRAKVLKNLKVKAKFFFSDMFRTDNIEHMTKNIGLDDDQVVWLYQYFTDYDTEPCSYPVSELEESFGDAEYKTTPDKNRIQYSFPEENRFVNVYLSSVDKTMAQRVEYVVGGYLIRTDYYSSGKIFSEFFVPRDGEARVCSRRFYNRDGKVAYEEFIDENEKEKEKEGESIFRFPDRIYYSKEELMAAVVDDIDFLPEDVVIADRTTLWGQPVFRHHKPAKLCIVLHAEHYSTSITDEHHILWNNYYEYVFDHADKVDTFITSTDIQNKTLKEQLEKYGNVQPHIVTIPVGALDKLRKPEAGRKPFAVLTTSRLASEKHVDWIAKAVIRAREAVPELTLDIYGTGGEEKKIREIIEDAKAEDYIRLMGHKNMDERYKDYSAYIAASTSEGFGLTLMEAVGSGLPMIGYDVPYGNQTFIADGENGYLLTVDREEEGPEEMVEKLVNGLVRLFTEADLKAFEKKSYQIAEPFLSKHIEEKWMRLVEGK